MKPLGMDPSSVFPSHMFLLNLSIMVSIILTLLRMIEWQWSFLGIVLYVYVLFICKFVVFLYYLHFFLKRTTPII